MTTTTVETSEEFVPATPAELSRFVAECSDMRMPICPIGGRTSLNYGYPLARECQKVSTAKLTDIVDYPSRDMTITVEAGIRMDELAKALKAENQRLPIDIAQSYRASLGGAIATNTSGPRRFGCGTFRDYVIGISAIDAGGRLFSAGGRVVKNVAGYDLCKMLVGSLGTLAIITQVTLKLRPQPETSALVWQTFDSYEQIDNLLGRLLTSEARPVAVEVLDARAAKLISSEARADLPADNPVVCLGVEGTNREIEWQVAKLKHESKPFEPIAVCEAAGDTTEPLWKALTEFETSSDDLLTFKANFLPSRIVEFCKMATASGIAIQAHAANGIVIGHVADEISSVEQAANTIAPLRRFTRQAHGNLTILQCDSTWKQSLPIFGDPEPSWPLMRELKSRLDPHNLLNPGQFIHGSINDTMSANA